MGSQQFCLRWNNHQNNLLHVFDQLLENEYLVDVTLACDGQSLKAHKVVLSACSPYFQALFVDNPCQHPIVILKDVNFAELRALIHFMYKGEVHVTQEQLNVLLKTAESLKVKGLAEVTGGNAQAHADSGVEIIRPHVNNNPTAPPHVDTKHHSPVENSEASPSGLPSHHPSPFHHHQPLLTIHPQGSSASHIIPPSALNLGGGSNSPPPKRRKAKPRKRVPESSIPSDQEDSDAIDMTTTSPEMMDPSCLETSSDPPERDRGGGGCYDDRDSNNQSYDHLQSANDSLDDASGPYPERIRSLYPSSSANQLSVGSAGMLNPRFPLMLKAPLQSLSTQGSPHSPSTSATQASIQDIRRLCQFSRQSQQHKPTWTEEDMVQALEAVQSGRLTYALAARKFDIPKATLHYYVILMKAVEAVRSGRMTTEVAAIKYNVRTSILMACLFGNHGDAGAGPPPGPGPGMSPSSGLGAALAAAASSPLSFKRNHGESPEGDSDFGVKKEL